MVGSEVGMFDYTLAMNYQMEFPLAKGLSLFASYNSPVSSSEDYKTGAFYRRRKTSGWRDSYLSQTFVLSSNLTTMFQVGKTSFVNDTYAFGQNETNLDSDDGSVQLGVVMGRYYGEDNDDVLPVLLGSYRYYWDKPDISFKITAGNFLSQDVGYKVESRHYFGDTHIYLMFRETDSKMAGMGFSVPLTPRKDMSPVEGFQLKGRPSWSYGLNTVIGEKRNPLTFGLATVPMERNNLGARYFNFDRMSPDYFYRHGERLRDAYYHYR